MLSALVGGADDGESLHQTVVDELVEGIVVGSVVVEVPTLAALESSLDSGHAIGVHLQFSGANQGEVVSDIAFDAASGQIAVNRAAQGQAGGHLQVLKRAPHTSGTLGQPRSVLRGQTRGEITPPDQGDVGHFPGQAHHLRAARANGDRYRMGWRTDQALTAHFPAVQQRADLGDGLAQRGNRFRVVDPQWLQTGPHTQPAECPTTGKVVERCERSGQHDWVTCVGVGDHGPHRDAAGCLSAERLDHE